MFPWSIIFDSMTQIVIIIKYVPLQFVENLTHHLYIEHYIMQPSHYYSRPFKIVQTILPGHMIKSVTQYRDIGNSHLRIKAV